LPTGQLPKKKHLQLRFPEDVLQLAVVQLAIVRMVILWLAVVQLAIVLIPTETGTASP